MKPLETSTDRYLDLKRLSERSCLGVSTLRGYIRDLGLPHYRLPGSGGKTGKIVVRWTEFNQWMTRFASNRQQEISDLAGRILEDFNRVSE